MNKRRLYLIGGVIVLFLMVAGICVGVTRCTRQVDVNQEKTQDDEEKESVLGESDDNVEQDDVQQEDAKKVEEPKPEKQGEQLTVQDGGTTQGTSSSFEEWNGEESEDSTGDSNEDLTDNGEDEDTELSSSVTDEHSDKQWSPFY